MRLNVQQWGPGFDRLAGRIRQMLDEMRGPNFFCSHARPSWSPKVNVYETGTHIIVCADLAGVAPDDIELRFVGGALQIEGSRRRPAFPPLLPGSDTSELTSVHLMEIDSGRFCRAVPLPFDIDAEEISAAYRQGFLWIAAPKQAAAGREST